MIAHAHFALMSEAKSDLFAKKADERVLSRTVEGLFYSCGSVLQGLEWKFNQVKIHQCLLCSIECSFVRRDNIHYVDTAKARETSQS